MKNKIKLWGTTLSIGLTLVLSSCTDTEFKPLPFETTNSNWVATHTLTQFIDEFVSEKGDIFPVRENSGALNLYSVDTIRHGGSDIIIRGRVVSEDREGNIYKSITIQDLADPKIGIKISVDAGSMSALYPVGQEISIRCNGMAIGKYAEMYQMGIVYYNNDADTKKKGYEPGRMPLVYFLQNIKATGLPHPELVKPDTLTIAQILTSNKSIHSRLVYIKKARFTQTEKGAAITNGLIFAPSTDGVGYPQSRDINDGTGTIAIATSEYSTFAKRSIPESKYVGDITAIVGWYHDKAAFAGSWQLTIRSLNDLGKGFEPYHLGL